MTLLEEWMNMIHLTSWDSSRLLYIIYCLVMYRKVAISLKEIWRIYNTVQKLIRNFVVEYRFHFLALMIAVDWLTLVNDFRWTIVSFQFWVWLAKPSSVESFQFVWLLRNRIWAFQPMGRHVLEPWLAKCTKYTWILLVKKKHEWLFLQFEHWHVAFTCVEEDLGEKP